MSRKNKIEKSSFASWNPAPKLFVEHLCWWKKRNFLRTWKYQNVITQVFFFCNKQQIRELILFLLPTNNLQADEFVSILPNITEKLKLWLSYEADVEFCRKLKTEILNFDTNKLQTEVSFFVLITSNCNTEKWKHGIKIFSSKIFFNEFWCFSWLNLLIFWFVSFYIFCFYHKIVFTRRL